MIRSEIFNKYKLNDSVYTVVMRLQNDLWSKIFLVIASSGKQIIGITVIQSLGTFLFVSLVFAIVLSISGLPLYLSFIFGGIALATAPAPALSIVNEYHTRGPVTEQVNTLS